MTLLERLRKVEPDGEGERTRWYRNPDGPEAADEIERLRKDYALAWENHLLHEQIFVLTEAKIERLREALHRISHAPNGKVYCADGHEEAVLIARSALQQKDNE